MEQQQKEIIRQTSSLFLIELITKGHGAYNLYILYIYLFSTYLSYIYCYFKWSFLSPVCQRKFFIFMLCILMYNKDLFDLICFDDSCTELSIT